MQMHFQSDTALQRRDFNPLTDIRPVLLSVITMTYSSIILLPFIALATITIASQQVKGDDSTDVLSSPGGCISDWRGLIEEGLP